MGHGKRELRDTPGKGEPCWRGIEQAAPDHGGSKVPHARDMVHIEREVVHGSFPPPRHMEGLCWQREPSSSGKHFEEDGIKKVANEAPGGSNTGFIRHVALVVHILLHGLQRGEALVQSPQDHRCLPQQSTGLD